MISMLIDLHVHSSISPCGHMDLPEIVAKAKQLGLGGVCITDHDTMAAADHLTPGIQDNGVLVVVGTEYATAQGDFLLFGPVRAIASGLDGAELLGEVRVLGGVAVAAHPFRANRPADANLLRQDGCNIIETRNGRNTDEENRLAQQLADSRKLLPAFGSDAHRLDELGNHPTEFFDEITSLDELVLALKEGRFGPPQRDVQAA